MTVLAVRQQRAPAACRRCMSPTSTAKHILRRCMCPTSTRVFAQGLQRCDSSMASIWCPNAARMQCLGCERVFACSPSGSCSGGSSNRLAPARESSAHAPNPSASEAVILQWTLGAVEPCRPLLPDSPQAASMAPSWRDLNSLPSPCNRQPTGLDARTTGSTLHASLSVRVVDTVRTW